MTLSKSLALLLALTAIQTVLLGQGTREWNASFGRVADSSHYYGLDGAANSLAVFSDQLVVGGDFGASGLGTDIAGLAKWDGSDFVEFAGGVHIVASGTRGVVHDMTVFQQGGPRLLVVGNFTHVGRPPNRVAADRAAIWDGTSWSAAVTGLPSTAATNTNYACATLPEGSGSVPLLSLWDNNPSSGQSCTIAGSTRPKYARVFKWNPSTSNWSLFGAPMDGTMNNAFNGLDVLQLPGGSIQPHFAIRYGVCPGDVSEGATRVTNVGSPAWTPYDNEIFNVCFGLDSQGPGFPIRKFAYFDPGDPDFRAIYFGGSLFECSGLVDNGLGPLARIMGTAGVGDFEELPLEGETGNGQVTALLPFTPSGCSDPSRLYVGGNEITPPLDERDSGLWAFRDGDSPSEWTFPTGHDVWGVIGSVHDLVEFEGDLIVAGDFSQAGSRTYFNVARLTCSFVCKADFNGDGFVTGDDFDAFTAAFELGDHDADFNEDGFVAGDDFDAFGPVFEAGC